MTNNLLDILSQYTNLTEDVDLFYLEMPLGKSGLWLSDRQTDNARTGYKEYDIYYRGKNKQQCIDNIDYISNAIENMTECSINGEIFKLRVVYSWDYMEKDSEGYFVFTNTLRLI